MGLFSSITDTLFGSGGGGQTLAPSTNTSQSSMNQRLFGPQAGLLSRLFGQAGGILNQDPQSFLAGFNPTQIQGQQSLLGAAEGLPLDQIGQAQSSLLNPSQNPFFQQQLQSTLNPFIRNFQQNILPGIRGQAEGVGQSGGSREGIAEGLASQGLLDQLGGITANMGSNAFNTGIQGQLGALGLSPQLAGLSFLPGQIQSQVGGQQQAQTQAGLNAPFDLLSRIQSLIGSPITLGSSQSTSSGTGQVTQGAGRPGLLGNIGLNFGNPFD